MDIPSCDLVVPLGLPLPAHGDSDTAAVRGAYQQGVRQSRCSGDEDVLHRQFGYGRKVHALPYRADGEEYAECQIGILDAVFDDAGTVVLPLVIHVLGVDVKLLLPQDEFGYGVEGLLFRSEFLFHRPPCVGDQPSLHPPESLAEEPRLSAVPSPR